MKQVFTAIPTNSKFHYVFYAYSAVIMLHDFIDKSADSTTNMKTVATDFTGLNNKRNRIYEFDEWIFFLFLRSVKLFEDCFGMNSYIFLVVQQLSIVFHEYQSF